MKRYRYSYNNYKNSEKLVIDGTVQSPEEGYYLLYLMIRGKSKAIKYCKDKNHKSKEIQQ